MSGPGIYYHNYGYIFYFGIYKTWKSYYQVNLLLKTDITNTHRSKFLSIGGGTSGPAEGFAQPQRSVDRQHADHLVLF